MRSTPCAGFRLTTRAIHFSLDNFQRRIRARNVLEGFVSQIKKDCWVVDLGLLPYVRACQWQRDVVEARKADSIPDVLLLCEHPHVITLGRNGRREHLRVSDRVLAQQHVEFHPTDRGGDITYHGPGQIVGYPILDLAAHRRDIRWYVTQLEEAMIRASADFGVHARRVEGKHGIWVDGPAGATQSEVQNEEKLAALGVHLSRWVTSHGFAYNVSTDLRYFDLIVPCGLADARSTTLERILGRAVEPAEARTRLVAHFAEVFGLRPEAMSREALAEILNRRRAHHAETVAVAV
jgi:lipoate-protein ligase B